MNARVLPRSGGQLGLGNAVKLLRNPLATLLAAHREHGPVFELRAAQRRFVVLAGKEANRFVGGVGRTAFESNAFWGKITEHRGCPHTIIAVDGEPHRVQRKNYGDVLSKRLVDDHRQACDALVQSALPQTGVFEVRSACRLLVARLVHHCLSGGASPLDEPTARSLLEVFRWETNSLLLGKWPRLALRTPMYRHHLAATERFLNQLQGRHERAAAAGELAGWFERVHRGQQQYPELFTPGDVRMALFLPFVAGVDTVGATLGFILYELQQNPQLQRSVRAEVNEAYAAAGGPPDVATLKAQPNLLGLVLECLRLYPAAFAMYRRATTDFELEGYHVESGTDVVVFTSATHFDETYFPNALELDVTRHAPPRSETRQKHVFMPYGAGPHVCLGAGMGEALLLTSTAGISRHYDLSRASPDRPLGPTFDPSLTVSPRFRLRARRGRANVD